VERWKGGSVKVKKLIRLSRLKVIQVQRSLEVFGTGIAEQLRVRQWPTASTGIRVRYSLMLKRVLVLVECMTVA
jgi:hypothetical protein